MLAFGGETKNQHDWLTQQHVHNVSQLAHFVPFKSGVAARFFLGSLHNEWQRAAFFRCFSAHVRTGCYKRHLTKKMVTYLEYDKYIYIYI